MLDELDRELEHRGHAFVRYADDGNIYVRSAKAGQRVMQSVSDFITRRLKLKVNESKSAVDRPSRRKFLGFTIAEGAKPQRRIAPKALKRFREKVRELTRRTKGRGREADGVRPDRVPSRMGGILRLLSDAVETAGSGMNERTPPTEPP